MNSFSQNFFPGTPLRYHGNRYIADKKD